MNSTGIYSVTSIGRPLEPAYPTNKAVLLAMPAAALVYFGLALWRSGLDVAAVTGAVSAAAAALGGWALVRELAPDDEPRAFVGLVGAVAAYVFVPQASVLQLFAILMLTRIVNRTVGLPARVSDSVVVCGLVGWTVVSTGLVSLGAGAAVAFAIDAILDPSLKRQWLFSIACAVGTVAALLYVGAPPLELPWTWGLRAWVLLAVLAAFAVRIARTRTMRSKGDASGEGLNPRRVRAGMWLAVLILAPALLAGNYVLGQTVLIWTSVGSLADGRGLGA